MVKLEEVIKQMPKVILHLHLDGSLRPETVKEWLAEAGEEVSIEEVKNRLMVEKNCRDLNEYLEKFNLPVEMLQTAEHIERATYELYEDLSKQGAIYAEIRFAPSKHLEKGLTYDKVVEASIRGLNRAKEELDIDGSLILCCMRGNNEQNKQENIETVKVAKKYLGKGVSAVDLAGAEALFKTENFEDIFDLAGNEKVPFTIHAGEADGPESIRKALQFINRAKQKGIQFTSRIGHGVRCIEDKKLMGQLAQEETILEICPTSNMQTKAVEGKHPIEEIYKAGIPVTVSPDNSTVSNTSILDEYEYILKNTNLTVDDLVKMNLNAARAIFGTTQGKAEVVNKIKQYKEEKEHIK